MRRFTVKRILIAVTAVMAMVAAQAASASAATSTFVTMFSEPGDYIGQGQARIFDHTNGTVTLSGNSGYLTVHVSGGNLGDSYSLDIAAPPGEKLQGGLYANAQRAAFREAGRPGLDVSGDGRGCNQVGGRFDVKDILVDTQGQVRRLWLTYEQHCEQGITALFGEIRFNVTNPDPTSVLEPGLLAWPDVDLGRGSNVVPVTLVNTGVADLTLAGARIKGPHATDFQIRSDECTGLTLGTSESCQVWTRFVPTVGGPRLARLVVPDSSGRPHGVSLEAAGILGQTQVTLNSDSGDYIGGGKTYSYSPANARISASGTRSYVGVSIDPADGGWWTADFEAPEGDILAPGSYPSATRYPFNGPGAGLDFSGMGRGCNTLRGSFTVRTIGYNVDGTLKHFGTDFEQHCEGGTPALRGSIDYRVPVGDVTRPDRVTNLLVTRNGNQAQISWTNPTNPDLAKTIVRYVYGTRPPGDALSGQLAYIGVGTSKQMAVTKVRPLAVAVFTVDRSGNVSRAATATANP